ncbi:hypothetical protein CIPAW_06G103500 [Carya illinoinensis]|uniref:4-coumarate--CoA ligase n=1 Tax=Carya illinoinensis TaxID=32201 RepID=A0A8T1QAG2_CARIL|nr:hypothetical protein CIPAW_06G103500 [Carya illinoinensis]
MGGGGVIISSAWGREEVGPFVYGNLRQNLPHNEEHIFRSRFLAVLVPDDITLPQLVLQDAEVYADKVAFVEVVTRKEVTYSDVVRNQEFAKALSSLGLSKGHIAIVAWGITVAGGVFLDANPTTHASEIKKQVEAAEAKLIVTNGPNYEKVKGLRLLVIIHGEELIEGAMNWNKLLKAANRASTNITKEDVHQTDLCALPFSSGTTGLSNGVKLTHRNLCVGPYMVGQVTTLGLIPFFHIYGIIGICCATLRNKGKVVEVTFAPIVPPIILQLVNNPIVEEFDRNMLKLWVIMSVASPLALELLTAFENKFPGVHVQKHSCITLTLVNPETGSWLTKKNSVSYILLNLEVKFIDLETGRSVPKNTTGEIYVRSQCVMQGYYNNNEETAQIIDDKAWLHTSDIGFINEEEDVFVVDRIKELIKYKGFQVALIEHEAILLTHPSIEDTAIVLPPDKEAGEIPAASVVVTPSATENAKDVIDYVASNVAHYKKVRMVQFVDTIPKSHSEK